MKFSLASCMTLLVILSLTTQVNAQSSTNQALQVMLSVKNYYGCPVRISTIGVPTSNSPNQVEASTLSSFDVPKLSILDKKTYSFATRPDWIRNLIVTLEVDAQVGKSIREIQVVAFFKNGSDSVALPLKTILNKASFSYTEEEYKLLKSKISILSQVSQVTISVFKIGYSDDTFWKAGYLYKQTPSGEYILDEEYKKKADQDITDMLNKISVRSNDNCSGKGYTIFPLI